ncbi:MAG: helix-turn-helix transcriptional regulator [Methylocystis sp.]|jgi:DNA-binding transcriptional ArsR family regulator|nr:helix-turn-helix transcriptional regulator [Roseomonas sp.]MCA3305610.1 helix-turn-helix transcriptional regulator [Roseomonas sp.]MCA3313942.1 helix-turn-helix transcriptional regulator [Roseomonas sp.]MCA3344911.1 helix-turn-helix transcriptional regulator [Roseomonas sp.]MCA3584749.1 helix-turn-helix transcriptional regulator [Methylocystis sp.]
MLTIVAIAETAALLGEPARAAMFSALMDGRALTAAELAATAGVTPQTASGHLGRLIEAGLLVVEKQGRHRYHRLASPAVARMVESIMQVAGAAPRQARPPRVGPADAALRAARTCYDHLAGRLGVGIADALVARGHVELGADGGAVTPTGEAFLASFGIAARLDGARRGRPFCRPCLDWSERRPHLAGVLGASLCVRCLELGWLRRRPGTRALEITHEGRRGFGERFGVDAG